MFNKKISFKSFALLLGQTGIQRTVNYKHALQCCHFISYSCLQ